MDRPATVAAAQTQAFLPTIAVNNDGTIGVSYYDFRNDVSGDVSLITDVWFRHSHDAGASWREDHLAGAFDLRAAPRSKVFGRISYTALIGGPAGFLFVVAKPNMPTSTTGSTDIHFARVKAKP